MYMLYLNSELERHDAHRATDIKTPDTTNNKQHTTHTKCDIEWE